MLKILRIGSTPSTKYPGAGQAVLELSKSDYFETDLITYSPPIYKNKNPNLNLHVVPFNNPTRPKSGSLILLIKKMILRVAYVTKFSISLIPIAVSKNFDVVHIHTPMHFLIGLFIKVLKKSKIVLTIHGSEIKLFEKYKSLRFILYIYDAILVVSNEQLQIISNLVGQKVIHIPNAIDSKFFEQPISSPKYSLSPKNKKKVSIVSIGSLRWQKNHAMLIKGISLSKYKDEIELNLVGVGAEIDSLKDLAKRTNVDINFTGTLNQDDVIKILDTSDLFILPSIVEGAPKALIEAMARGIYCITTPVGDCQSILNGSGHCLSSFSPADLALQIDKYLDYPLEMETAQIKKLTKTYTWKNYLKIHSKIYENL